MNGSQRNIEILLKYGEQMLSTYQSDQQKYGRNFVTTYPFDGSKLDLMWLMEYIKLQPSRDGSIIVSLENARERGGFLWGVMHLSNSDSINASVVHRSIGRGQHR